MSYATPNSATFKLFVMSANWGTYATSAFATDEVTSITAQCPNSPLVYTMWEAHLSLPNIFAAQLAVGTNYCVGAQAPGNVMFGRVDCSSDAASTAFGNDLVNPLGPANTRVLYGNTFYQAAKRGTSETLQQTGDYNDCQAIPARILANIAI